MIVLNMDAINQIEKRFFVAEWKHLKMTIESSFIVPFLRRLLKYVRNRENNACQETGKIKNYNKEIKVMASTYYEEVNCPQCHTKVRVKITNGIYPMRDREVANCPVCWKELFHKNITGDIEESVISLEETIEP